MSSTDDKKEDIKKKEETHENKYEPVPNQLNINIRTSIPGHQFIQFKGENLKLDLGKDYQSVLFNPTLKLPQEIIKKIPENIRKTQFFKKGYYESLMNYIKTKTSFKQTNSLSHAIQNGFIDNNIEFTLDCLFPENGVIYIGNRPFVIIDKQWTKGDWNIDIKNKPVEITSNDIKNPFLKAAIVQNEILAGKEQLENMSKMNIQGPNFVETPEYIAEKEVRDQKEALEIMKLKKEVVAKIEKDQEMQKKIKESEDKFQMERQQREIEKSEFEKKRKESEQLVKENLKKLKESEDEKKRLLKEKDASNADALKKIQAEIEASKNELRKAKSELEKANLELVKANEKENKYALVLRENDKQLALIKSDLKTVSLISNKLDKLAEYYPPPVPSKAKSKILLQNASVNKVEELEDDSSLIKPPPEITSGVENTVEIFTANTGITSNLNFFLKRINGFLEKFNKRLPYKIKKTQISVRTPSVINLDFLDTIISIINYCNYWGVKTIFGFSPVTFKWKGKTYGYKLPITKDILKKIINSYYEEENQENYSYKKVIKALNCLLNLNIVVIKGDTIINKEDFIFLNNEKCVRKVNPKLIFLYTDDNLSFKLIQLQKVLPFVNNIKKNGFVPIFVIKEQDKTIEQILGLLFLFYVCVYFDMTPKEVNNFEIINKNMNEIMENFKFAFIQTLQSDSNNIKIYRDFKNLFPKIYIPELERKLETNEFRKNTTRRKESVIRDYKGMLRKRGSPKIRGGNQSGGLSYNYSPSIYLTPDMLKIQPQSQIAFYITIDMELYPGKKLDLNPKTLEKLKCRHQKNAIRKSYAQMLGKPYIIPPVYDENFLKDIDTVRKTKDKDKTKKSKDKYKPQNQYTRKKSFLTQDRYNRNQRYNITKPQNRSKYNYNSKTRKRYF